MIELRIFYLIIVLIISLSFNVMLFIQVYELLKENSSMMNKLGKNESKSIPINSYFINLLRKIIQ